MASEVAAPIPSIPPPAEVRTALQRVLSHPDFQTNQRLSAFLSHVVGRTLEDRGGEIKEATIGVEVFGRKPGYDTRSDAIVRTEACRLREKLTQYYLAAGGDPVRIEIPKGTYVPRFRLVAPPPSETKPIQGQRGIWIVVAAGSVLLLALALILGRAARDRSARKAVKTIAVLPFDNAAQDGRYQYLSAVSEDLERDLSRARQLQIRVDPPREWLSPRDGLDYRALSRRLQVDAVLDGRITVSNGQPEIRVSLIRASDASILWTDRFNSGTTTRAVETEIEQGLARALGVRLPRLQRAENPQAHDLFLEGRNLWATRNEKEGQESIQLFERALRLDPNYALAYMGIADAYGLLALHRETDLSTGIVKGKRAAAQAIALDPDLAEAHAALGLLDFVAWDWKNAEREYERAIELNPSYDRPYIRLGVLRFYDGDLQVAERLMIQAESLSPYSLSLPVIRAEFYYYLRRYGDSVKLARKVLQVDQRNASAMALLACDLRQQGHSADALEMVHQLHQTEPGFQLDLIPCVAAVGGLGERVIAAGLSPHESNAYIWAIIASTVYDREGAISWLEKSLAEHSPDLAAASFEPLFDFVRGDKRFQAVVAKERMGVDGLRAAETISMGSTPGRFSNTGLR